MRISAAVTIWRVLYGVMTVSSAVRTQMDPLSQRADTLSPFGWSCSGMWRCAWALSPRLVRMAIAGVCAGMLMVIIISWYA